MVELESETELARGDEAPDFSLPGTDGATHSLADYRDREALLVVFTCNHCPYAKAKYDTMNALAADYDEVAVVAINPNDAVQYPEDDFETMVEYVEAGKIDVDAYLRDESQAVARAYGAVCTPDPFLFAREDGGFRLAYQGRFDDALSPEDQPSEAPGFEMRAAIDEVLAGREVSLEWRPSRGCSIKWKPEN
jgi:peroxiredoxin